MDTTELGPAEEARGGTDQPWTLTVVFHPDATRLGAGATLAAGGHLVLGRRTEELGLGALDDERVSREHARIDVDGRGVIQMADLDSRNGTHVNGRRAELAPLADGDVVGIGRVMLLVHRAPARPTAEVLREAVDKVAARDLAVLLHGEPGTGKTRLAEEIHGRSGRTGALVTLPCGATAHDRAAGLFDAAAGGTLILDSIEDAGAGLQRALVPLFEDRSIGARVIATSHKTPRALADGLRGDLAHRVTHWTIRVPPLRERRPDLPLLAAELVRRFAGADRPLHHRFALALLRHDWPGNLHELEAVIERAVIEAEGDDEIAAFAGIEDLLGQSAAALQYSAPSLPRAAVMLEVAASGRWCQVEGGKRIDLDNRRALPHLLAALVERRRKAPGEPLSVAELVGRGWPGERMIESAGANRVYVAMTTLRKLGLRDFIVRARAGYLIDPAVTLRVVDG